MYKVYNPNPAGRHVGDCVIRAIAMLTGQDWDTTYMGVVMEGYRLKDMPSSNHVWGQYLKEHGYRKKVLPEECPSCYTVKDFCGEYSHGKYLLATGSHVVAAVSGDYYDSWDSGDEIVVYFFERAD